MSDTAQDKQSHEKLPCFRIAFFGGSFDPVHRGHLAIAKALTTQFALDKFVFIPAFHAPHKVRLAPTSAYDRYAMLCLLTENEPKLFVSKLEIEMPERPFSVETLTRINAEMPSDEIFFVMGADSWMDIKTWRNWEKVLSLSNHIVMSRPGIHLEVSHVTDEVRSRIIDMRGKMETRDAFTKVETRSAGSVQSLATAKTSAGKNVRNNSAIYITDTVNLDISATEIRDQIRVNDNAWKEDLPSMVANYIEKYQIYK